jgi:hypothetical protein
MLAILTNFSLWYFHISCIFMYGAYTIPFGQFLTLTYMQLLTTSMSGIYIRRRNV